MIIGLVILAILLVALFWFVSKQRKDNGVAQTPAEIIATSVGDKVTSVFSSTPATPKVLHSKYFEDQLYVGKTTKLDSTLKVMLTNVMFGFPDSPLIVSGFRYFDIDGNNFEEVVFEKIGTKNYIMLYDSFEEKIYFLNRVMTTGVQPHEVPPMASQDVIELTENNKTYEYTDFSGLIEVRVSDEKGFKNKRLIRVYNREITPEDDEFLICIQDKPDVVDYYLGFHISVLQLEDL